MLLEGSQSCQSDLYQTAQEEEDMEDEEDQGRSDLLENNCLSRLWLQSPMYR